MKILLSLLNRYKRKGQVVVCTALLLPFLLAVAGLAVDFGNVYARHMQLQNALDSSIEAAGWAYADNMDNSGIARESQSYHPKADTALSTYLKANHRNASRIKLTDPQQRVKINGSDIFYGVVGSETVPLTFTSIFVDKDMKISAAACVKIAEVEQENGTTVTKVIMVNPGDTGFTWSN